MGTLVARLWGWFDARMPSVAEQFKIPVFSTQCRIQSQIAVLICIMKFSRQGFAELTTQKTAPQRIKFSSSPHHAVFWFCA